MENVLAARDNQEINALKTLLPAYREGIKGLHSLAMRFSISGWRECFLHLWEEQAKCLHDLELKVIELGGDLQPPVRYGVTMELADPEDEPSDPLSLDKALLLKCLHQETHLVHHLFGVRKLVVPFDVRMILQRQHLRARDVLDRVASVYSAYPAGSSRFSEAQSGSIYSEFYAA